MHEALQRRVVIYPERVSRRSVTILIKVTIACLLFFLFLSRSAQAEPAPSSQPAIDIISNASVSVDQLSLRELRSIFAMKKRHWDDGQEISVFVLPSDSDLHKDFSKRRLNIFPGQLEAIWYRKVYTGTGTAPVTLASEAEMREKIAQTPGAIGYVSSQSVNKNNTEKTISHESTKRLSIH